MKIRILLSMFVCGISLLFVSSLFAREAVRSGPSIHKIGSTVGPILPIEQLLDQDPQIREFVEKSVLPNFRRQHECPGPNAEKDDPSQKLPSSSMSCRDFMTYKDARAKSEDLAKTCKNECLKNATSTAKGKSAAALKKCLTESCEKSCDFKNISQKVELDSFIRGAIDQNGDDARSM